MKIEDDNDMTEDIIEIEYRPVKKIIIREILELTNDELFTRTSAIRSAGQVAIPLSWAEGIVFLAFPASIDITEVDDNFMKGIAYFEGFTYSYMPKYKPHVEIGHDRIPIIDQSKDNIFKSIVKWLKKRRKET